MRRIPVAAAAFAVLFSSCRTPDGSDAGGILAADPSGPAPAVTSALTRVDLGTLGGASSYATDISIGHVVVGWSLTSAGTVRAFRWTAAGGMLDLGTLPGHSESQAIAILDGRTPDGAQILGVSGHDGLWTPVVWKASGTANALQLPAATGAERDTPTAFNTRGDVVGWNLVGGSQHGWVASPTLGRYDLTANAPGGSNEGSAAAVALSGVVALTTRAYTCQRTPSCWRAYLWTRASGYQALGTPGDDPETDVTALALNEGGTVAGWLATIAGGGGAYRWRAAEGFTLLPAHPSGAGGIAYAQGVDSRGTTVGGAYDPGDDAVVATTWPAGGGIARLSPDNPNPGVATAINARGSIVGWEVVADGSTHAVLWTRNAGVLAKRRSGAAPGARATTASARCLADRRALASRPALFACVVAADRESARAAIE